MYLCYKIQIKKKLYRHTLSTVFCLLLYLFIHSIILFMSGSIWLPTNDAIAVTWHDDDSIFQMAAILL